MNILTKIRLINELNEKELKQHVAPENSWHQQYKDSAWVYAGNLAYNLTEAGMSILKIIFTITSRILRIRMEHIEIKNSLDSKLQSFSICSVRILILLEVIAKMRLSQNSQPWTGSTPENSGSIHSTGKNQYN